MYDTSLPTPLAAIIIDAPSRVHFGLMSFGRAGGRQFGGAGMMVDRPRTRVTVRHSLARLTTGQQAWRAHEFASRWLAHAGFPPEQPCHIHVSATAQAHVGLGSGTQLALAVATGLGAFLDRPSPSVCELAQSLGRGSRSAVGTYGFQRGGFVAEFGRYPHQPLATEFERVAIPDGWRILLIRVGAGRGPSGAAERDAFQQLAEMPAKVSARLERVLRDDMLPAIKRSDLAWFGCSVFRFGTIAGRCFAHVQKGPFATPQSARIVALVRQRGLEGVGQSSWGPTLYALSDDRERLDRLGRELESLFPTVRCTIAAGDNRGARIHHNVWKV
jgi:beta-RFAP synthase